MNVRKIAQNTGGLVTQAKITQNTGGLETKSCEISKNTTSRMIKNIHRILPGSKILCNEKTFFFGNLQVAHNKMIKMAVQGKDLRYEPLFMLKEVDKFS